MKYLFLFASIIFFLTSVRAQNPGTIEGKIISKDPKAAESASLSLVRVQDSVAIKSSVVSKDGSYRFENIPEGTYFISVTAVGYQKIVSEKFEINASQKLKTVPPIPLLPANKDLASVTVTARRPLIEQKIDRTILNVDALLTNTGVSALEVLENTPGVTVDKEGNISLKGKEGVMILIDGRPTQLGGADLANLLRSMNSSQMDQVEVMTNPPARYDASGTSGIINIKTKKMLNAGYNGSATAGFMQGRYPKTNESFNFNYRVGKVNLFTNLGHNYRKGFGTLTIQRKILNSNTDELENYFNQRGDKINKGNFFNGKIGMDYFLSKKTTVGIVVNGASSPSESSNNNQINILNPANELEQITRASVDQTSDWKSFNSNINFRTVFDAKGKELTSDLDYINYSSETRQFMVNSYFDETGNSIIKADTLQGHLPQDIKVLSGRLDYLHPLKKGARFETGIKSSLVETDNNASYDSTQYGIIVHDFNRSNHFVYEENVNALYANISTPLSKKLSAQLGLRLENTNAKGVQKTTGEKFSCHYTQLFPTAYFQYKANEKNNFVINYGRRVRRPNYQSLNPFIRFIDRYTYSKGNPNLRPQVSDNIEITHSWRNLVTTTLNYSFTKDIFDNVIEQKGQEAYLTPANIASQQQFGITVGSNIPVTKWWTSNVNINVFNNGYEGVVSNTPVSLRATSFILNGIQQFKLSKSLSAEINGRYRSGWYDGFINARPIGFVGLGFSQQVLNNAGTVRLTLRDIFYTQKFRGNSRYGNVDFSFQDVGDTRVVAIAFSYRFSKGKKIAPAKRTSGSANEEQERIGNEN
jgi:iron complex outermembrane receptor protein